MKLLEPYFLYAFLALAIPILIHLFSLQKHKTVFFSNVSFLRQLQQKKSTISKLQKLLLLFVRLLLLSAIILAFCEPYISKKEASTQTKHLVGVYIDNSFSMGGNNDKGQLIEQAKNHARSILNAHKGKDEFVFLNNELLGKHQRIIDYNDCIEAIDNTEIAPNLLPLKSVINRFKSIIKNQSNKQSELYLIGDFQKSSSSEDFYTDHTNTSIHLLPISSYPQANLSIDTCYLENPNHTLVQQETLYFTVSNTSNELIENLNVKLFINGNQKALSTLKVEANSSTVAKLIFNNHTTGLQQGSIELSDATISFDNRLYFNYLVESSTKVLAIHEELANKSLVSLFKDPIFEYASERLGQLNFSKFKEHQLIILEDLSNPTTGFINSLKEYTKQGGNILIIPSKELNLNSYKALASALNIPKFTKENTGKVQISSINKNHKVFKDVFEKQVKDSDYPEVNFYYSLDNSYNSTEENILLLNSKEAFLNSYKFGLGTIYLQTSPLTTDANKLENHALFVPLLYNIATQSTKLNQLYYTLGKDRLISLTEMETQQQWTLKKDSILDFIPEVRTVNQRIQITVPSVLNKDGFYSLSNGREEKILSFNYDRQESVLTAWELEELEEISKQYPSLNVWHKEGLELEEALKENRSGTPLWRVFILLALFFILIESLLLKNWKKKAQINLEN